MSDGLPIAPTITIRAEPSRADPDSLKFAVSRIVHPGGPFLFAKADRDCGSPLVERLFAISGLATVLVAENVVTITKEATASWSDLKAPVAAAIRSQLLTPVPAIVDLPRGGASKPRTDAEVRVAVQSLLDTQVNRAVGGHGGKISIVDYRDGDLLIAMSGGCQGCAASQVTLRRGLEVMVRRVAPEVANIVDTTDHAAGKRPFYERTGTASD
ncbi:MAG: NifU family protein [Deltaproteobacteria bacterium]|nr:NifU family protein [Deltaproteobacteria bacterium]